MDLIIRNVRLADGSQDNQPVDIGIENGRIAAIAPRLNAVAEVYDAKGCLASTRAAKAMKSTLARITWGSCDGEMLHLQPPAVNRGYVPTS